MFQQKERQKKKTKKNWFGTVFLFFFFFFTTNKKWKTLFDKHNLLHFVLLLSQKQNKLTKKKNKTKQKPSPQVSLCISIALYTLQSFPPPPLPSIYTAVRWSARPPYSHCVDLLCVHSTENTLHSFLLLVVVLVLLVLLLAFSSVLAPTSIITASLGNVLWVQCSEDGRVKDFLEAFSRQRRALHVASAAYLLGELLALYGRYDLIIVIIAMIVICMVTNWRK